MATPRRSQLLGSNREEIRASLWIGICGTIFWLLLFPSGHAYDAPLLENVLNEWRHRAGAIAIAAVSWLCALNAYRDPTNTLAHRISIVVWLTLLTLWIGVRLFEYGAWALTLPQ